MQDKILFREKIIKYLYEDMRYGLQTIVNASEDFEVLEVYPTADEAVKSIPACKPDIVLMDINMPGISGVVAVEKLKPMMPDTEFLMCTVFQDDENIFEALRAGASGYLLKKSSPGKILEALTELVNGGAPVS